MCLYDEGVIAVSQFGRPRKIRPVSGAWKMKMNVGWMDRVGCNLAGEVTSWNHKPKGEQDTTKQNTEKTRKAASGQAQNREHLQERAVYINKQREFMHESKSPEFHPANLCHRQCTGAQWRPMMLAGETCSDYFLLFEV